MSDKPVGDYRTHQDTCPECGSADITRLSLPPRDRAVAAACNGCDYLWHEDTPDNHT